MKDMESMEGSRRGRSVERFHATPFQTNFVRLRVLRQLRLFKQA